jgi:hypothetical protein
MLINKSYFENGNRYLPNMIEPDPNNRNVIDLISTIEFCENDLYLSAFGFLMSKDFKSILLPNGGYKDDTPQHYLNLINGKYYEKDGKTFYWLGLIQESPKASLIADYVYYVYKNNNATQTTEYGEISIDSKIGNKASNTPKMVEAWNCFVNGFCGDFRANADGYTLEGNPFWYLGERGIDYYGFNSNNKNVSLIKFLDDNREDYSLLDLDPRSISLSHKNSFGL